MEGTVKIIPPKNVVMYGYGTRVLLADGSEVKGVVDIRIHVATKEPATVEVMTLDHEMRLRTHRYFVSSISMA